MTLSIETNYRYVKKVPGVCGGRPLIDGTRTTVATIVGYYQAGLTIEETLEGLPHLTPAQVHEAFSYYYDHRSEMEADKEEGKLENLLEAYDLRIGPDNQLLSNETHD
jgi:uncharacterized protein (DUF433 family)